MHEAWPWIIQPSSSMRLRCTSELWVDSFSDRCILLEYSLSPDWLLLHVWRKRQTDRDWLTDWALTFKEKDVKQKPNLTKEREREIRVLDNTMERERERDQGTWQHNVQRGALLWTDWWRVHEDRGFSFDELGVNTCFKCMYVLCLRSDWFCILTNWQRV